MKVYVYKCKCSIKIYCLIFVISFQKSIADSADTVTQIMKMLRIELTFNVNKIKFTSHMSGASTQPTLLVILSLCQKFSLFLYCVS